MGIKSMEPRQEEKKRPSRAELEQLAVRHNEQLQGKLRGHVDGDAEEVEGQTRRTPRNLVRARRSSKRLRLMASSTA